MGSGWGKYIVKDGVKRTMFNVNFLLGCQMNKYATTLNPEIWDQNCAVDPWKPISVFNKVEVEVKSFVCVGVFAEMRKFGTTTLTRV